MNATESAIPRLPCIVGAFVAFVVALTGPCARANDLLSLIRLPGQVTAIPVIEGMHWQGFELHLAAVDSAMAVEAFLEGLTPLLPEHALLSIRGGIATVHWALNDTSVSLYLAHRDGQGTTGALTAMRRNRQRPAGAASHPHCRDTVARHIVSYPGALLLFDLVELPARIRAYALDAGVDELVGRLRHAMPADGWTLMSQRATSAPGRSVSLESVCGRQRLQMEIALTEGRATVIAFDTDQ